MQIDSVHVGQVLWAGDRVFRRQGRQNAPFAGHETGKLCRPRGISRALSQVSVTTYESRSDFVD